MRASERLSSATAADSQTNNNTLLRRVWSTVRAVSRHTHLKNQLSVFTALCFVTSSTLLPSFAALNTQSTLEGTDTPFFVPYEDDQIDDLLRNSDMVVSGNDGVLANPIMSDVQGLPEGKKVQTYVVKNGDTLSGLATEYGIDADTIVFNNNVKDGSITPGQTLYIPPVDGLLYEVKEDQDLAKIADEYKTDVTTMADINDMTAKAQLRAGERIVIPGMNHIVALKEKMAAEELAEKNRIAEEVRKEQEKRQTLLAEKEKQRIADAKKAATAKTTASTSSSAKSAPASAGTPAAGKKIRYPLSGGVITQGYKYGHAGIDWAYTKGDHTTSIHSVASGKVIQSTGGWNGGYGNVVVVDHGNGMQTRYAHLREIYVKKGQQVSSGQMIGWMGNTGRVYGRTGLHLHFELIINGRRVNPMAYL